MYMRVLAHGYVRVCVRTSLNMPCYPPPLVFTPLTRMANAVFSLTVPSLIVQCLESVALILNSNSFIHTSPTKNIFYQITLEKNALHDFRESFGGCEDNSPDNIGRMIMHINFQRDLMRSRGYGTR